MAYRKKTTTYLQAAKKANKLKETAKGKKVILSMATKMLSMGKVKTAQMLIKKAK